MQPWAAVVISLLTVIVIALLAYIILRIFFPNQLETLFAIGEERLSLTKSDSRANYYAAQHPETGAQVAQTAPIGRQGASAGGSFSRREFRDDAVEDSDTGPGRHSPGDTTGSEYEPGHNLPRVGSAESLASDTSVMDMQPDVSPIGQVEMGLEYDRDVSELVVSLIQGRDLASSDATGVCDMDFFACLAVVPDVANMKSQTKVVKRNPNPVFKERFLYSLEPHQLAQKSLQLQMFSVDKYARQKHIGETEIRLADVDLQRPLRLWLNLRELDQKPSDFGELMFSLSYLPTAERLTVVIVKAKNLKWPRQDQSVGDVLVKVHLLQGGKRVTKKKTSVKRSESQPTYNEAMIFSVSQASLSSVQLRLTVAELRSDGRLSSIGHVIIGSQAGGAELTHWQQMVTSLRKPVAMWHHLRKK
ncbi:hypothetical protein BOX15_Mlig019295g1 [Macrostomum lignano]|uniref:C2 domain-containing protein n=1 Tax=Macrostomum lignano TaxID=282301 RepID=A0A267DUV4_9PLAT|nr:hypothetical protein BOX15_Mlig019295g1 [Macrostomum lignano]